MQFRTFACATALSTALPVSLLPGAFAHELSVELVASGLSLPIALTAPPGDLDRQFVLEQITGRILVIEDGVLLPVPFLDLGKVVGKGFEDGLLGLAFHPDYANNGRFFVNHTDVAGDTHVVEY